MGSNNFKSALTANQLAIDDPLQTQMDLKIFQRGLIYAHPQNPERNIKKSRKYFQEVIENYPDSTLATAAAILILSLDKIAKTEKALQEHQKTIETHQSKIKNQAILINDQANRINELNNQILLLKEQIENYKTIDLNTEKKKKADIFP